MAKNLVFKCMRYCACGVSLASVLRPKELQKPANSTLPPHPNPRIKN